MISSSCSTTIKVLPKSRISFKASINLWLSRWWRPIDGSSKTYKTPVNLDPICVASLIRWASPPERLPAFLDSVRYSKPTSFKKANRLWISFIIRLPIFASSVVSCKLSTKVKASLIDISVNSYIFLPPTLTDNALSDKRIPWQVGHITSRIYDP